jgi:peptidoglycan/LPS O-acetylase OafA/YrhL
MQAHNDNRIFGLDLLRVIAICLVVFSSIFFIVPDTKGIIYQFISIAGVLGVEIFLVLSGFLVGRTFYKIYIKTGFNFRNIIKFWKRRWLRVLPNYFLALIIGGFISLYIGQKLPLDLWKYPLFLQNFTSDINSGFYYESWSISIGEFATLLGPLLLYLSLLIKTKIPKPKLFLFVTIAVIVMFLASKWSYSMNDDVKTMITWSRNLKTAVIYRIDAVYYGVLAAYISMIYPKFWRTFRYFGLLLSLLLLFSLHVLAAQNYWYIETHSVFWNIWYLPLNSVAILLLLPFLSQWESVSKIADRPIRFLSSISYAIFVIHYSIVLRLLMYNLSIDNLPKFDSIIYILVYISLLMLFGYVINRYFEKPITVIQNSSKFNRFFK